VANNIFLDSPPKTLLYKNKYNNFLIDGNMKLVHGWAKQTDKKIIG